MKSAAQHAARAASAISNAQLPPSDTFGFAFACIGLAFVIYITARGELATYLGFFIWSPAGTAASGTAPAQAPPATGSTSPSSPNTSGAAGGSQNGAPQTTTPNASGSSLQGGSSLNMQNLMQRGAHWNL